MVEKQVLEQEIVEREKVILPFEACEEFFVEDLGTIDAKPVYSFLKRAMDIFCSALCLLLFFVPMVLIALCICCTSKGGCLYRQERLGLNGKKFNIIKFRTMYVDAEKHGAQWSAGDADVRITKIGRILRKTRLDELPQLWCILKGEMSLVGPRPEREVFYDEFEKYIHGFRERLKVKPGLTGLAQVNGGYHLKPEEKILYDVEYIKKRSMRLDIKIIFATVRVVFHREGAK